MYVGGEQLLYGYSNLCEELRAEFALELALSKYGTSSTPILIELVVWHFNVVDDLGNTLGSYMTMRNLQQF